MRVGGILLFGEHLGVGAVSALTYRLHKTSFNSRITSRQSKFTITSRGAYLCRSTTGHHRSSSVQLIRCSSIGVSWLPRMAVQLVQSSSSTRGTIKNYEFSFQEQRQILYLGVSTSWYSHVGGTPTHHHVTTYGSPWNTSSVTGAPSPVPFSPR